MVREYFLHAGFSAKWQLVTPLKCVKVTMQRFAYTDKVKNLQFGELELKPPEAFALQMLPCFCLPNHFFNDWLRKAVGTRGRKASKGRRKRKNFLRFSNRNLALMGNEPC